MVITTMENITIRPNMKIGQLDAENDTKFLSECYVDNNIIEILVDTSSSEALILGRTGAGKTASLITVNNSIDKEYSKLLDLEGVFLRYIDNSNIIKFLTENDVNLDLFYKYLWRHILTVEFLKLKYPHIEDKNKFFQFINDLRDLIRKPEEKTALNYLETWSDKYWVETVENIEEIVKSFSSDISGEFEAGFLENKLSLGAGQNLSEEQKIQVKHRAQKVVNNLQISHLSKVINLMDKHVFNDSKKPYYLLIDKLDENWVSIEVKYSLIKGLIEEIRQFRNIKNVKILGCVDIYRIIDNHSVMTRLTLSDAQWAKIAPYCAGKETDVGRTAVNNRLFIEAVLWIVRTGSPWRDLPPEFGNWNSVYKRYRRWVKSDRFSKLFNALNDSDLEYAMIDGTIVKVHRHGQGAKGGLVIRQLANQEAV